MLVLVAVDEAVEEVGRCGEAGEGGLEGGQVWRSSGGEFCVVVGHENLDERRRAQINGGVVRSQGSCKSNNCISRQCLEPEVDFLGFEG